VVGEVVSAVDLRPHGRDADQVGLALDARHVEVRHDLVGEGDLVLGRRGGSSSTAA
jgi:hypothetical protein